MKLDAHCSVSPGFDKQLIADWQPGWTLVPTMHNLDVETFTPKMHKRTTSMYVGIAEGRVLRAEYYGSHQPKYDTPIHETMACMGPGWFLSAEDFWRQGGCDESHGGAAGWGQQGVEVSLKAWLSGGALMTDENCWFAHYFRGGGGPGFPYPISGREVEAAREYSRNLWLNNQWPGQVKTLEWLVKKFNPPGWDGYQFAETELQPVAKTSLELQHATNATMYQHIHSERREPTWKGVRIIKMPTDLLLYEQVIWRNKPKWIIETGTKFGGSSLYFQDMLDLVGEGGRVVTVDINAVVSNPDPRIAYLKGNSIDRALIQQLREMVGSDSVMVVLDSSHARRHVKWELHLYSSLVTAGQFLVVEDCYGRASSLYQPGEARDWFLTTKRGHQFEQTNLDRQFLVGVCLGGWLRRRA